MAAPARHGERLHHHAEPMLPDIYQPWPSPALAYPGPAGPAATASGRPGPAGSLLIPHLLVPITRPSCIDTPASESQHLHSSLDGGNHMQRRALAGDDGQRQVESALAMRSLQPQVKAIQERYAGDQEGIV